MKEEGQRGCSGEQREDNDERGFKGRKNLEEKRNLRLKSGRDDLQTCVIVPVWLHSNSRVSFCV